MNALKFGGRAALGGGLWLALSVLAGCADGDVASDPAPVASLTEGLTLVEADAAAGRLAGVFVAEGRTIYFEAERGEENPTQGDPDAPRFSVDARFADAAGRTFILSGGGGELARPDWAPDQDNEDPEERTKDLALLPALADELLVALTPVGLEYERDKLVQLAEELRGKELVVHPEGNVPYGCTPGYEHDMTIRYKAAFDLPVGHHTAVRLDSWYMNAYCTWVYQGYQESCNHGTCATAVNMGDWCSWYSPIRASKWPAFQVYTAYGNGACTSAASQK